MFVPGNGNSFKRPRNDNGDGNYQNKRRKPGEIQIRILIPSYIAGGLIGKGGENIRNLNSEFDIHMSLKQSHSAERVLVMNGSIENACRSLYSIIPRIESLQDENSSTEKISFRILIQNSLAGKIIGKGGETITKLNEDIGGSVKIFVPTCPMSDERVTLITGSLDQIVNYVRAIYELIDGVSLKGSTIEYDAENADAFTAHEYGGFGNSRGGRGEGRGGPSRGRGMRGARGGFDRGGYNRDFESRGGFNRGGAPPMGRGGYGRGGPPMPFMDYPNNSGFGGLGEMDEEIQSTQVSVPKRLAGAIIGKGGSRIRQIQLDSGARIKMGEEKNDCEDRIITINGSSDQIQCAQYLLQTAIKNF